MLIKYIIYITSDFKTDSWSRGIGAAFNNFSLLSISLVSINIKILPTSEILSMLERITLYPLRLVPGKIDDEVEDETTLRS